MRARRRPRPRGVPRRRRGRPARARPADARAGAAEPRPTRPSCRLLLARRRRRLGRRLAADARPRQPRAALAAPRRPARGSPPSAGFDAARAADRPPASTSAPASRGSTRGSRPHVARAGRPGDGLARRRASARRACRGRSPTRTGCAAAGRVDLHVEVDTDGPHRRPAPRLRRGLRRLGRRSATQAARRGRAGSPYGCAVGDAGRARGPAPRRDDDPAGLTDDAVRWR